MNKKTSRRAMAKVIAAKFISEPNRSKQWLAAAAAYLAENGTAKDSDLLARDIAHELYVQHGHLLVIVTSAKPLSPASRVALERMLKRATNAARIELNERTDADLLGGVMVTTTDHHLDLSIRTKLKSLANLGVTT